MGFVYAVAFFNIKGTVGPPMQTQSNDDNMLQYCFHPAIAVKIVLDYTVDTVHHQHSSYWSINW